MTQEDSNTIKFLGAIGIFTIGIASIIFVATWRNEVKDVNHKITVRPKPQPKDTTTYHFSDEFTDAQLREMVRSGHLKLR